VALPPCVVTVEAPFLPARSHSPRSVLISDFYVHPGHSPFPFAGYGFERPIASNSHSSKNAQNRPRARQCSISQYKNARFSTADGLPCPAHRDMTLCHFSIWSALVVTFACTVSFFRLHSAQYHLSCYFAADNSLSDIGPVGFTLKKPMRKLLACR
jgi:hypothetical protein